MAVGWHCCPCSPAANSTRLRAVTCSQVGGQCQLKANLWRLLGSWDSLAFTFLALLYAVSTTWSTNCSHICRAVESVTWVSFNKVGRITVQDEGCSQSNTPLGTQWNRTARHSTQVTIRHPQIFHRDFLSLPLPSPSPVTISTMSFLLYYSAY